MSLVEKGIFVRMSQNTTPLRLEKKATVDENAGASQEILYGDSTLHVCAAKASSLLALRADCPLQVKSLKLLTLCSVLCLCFGASSHKTTGTQRQKPNPCCFYEPKNIGFQSFKLLASDESQKKCIRFWSILRNKNKRKQEERKIGGSRKERQGKRRKKQEKGKGKEREK